MRKAILTVIVGLMAVWAPLGAPSAAPINLTPFAFTFNTPIGIDFQDTSNKLIMSVNYFTGLPHNLDLVDPVTGFPATFAPTIVGLTDEVKVASVRGGTGNVNPVNACLGGFAPGDIFIGNGNPGAIVRLGPTGTPTNSVSPFTWVTLPGEPAHLRGSMFQDRSCVAAGDLIAVTGNDQIGTPANDLVGNVWRVTSGGTVVGGAPLATIGTHLEGVVTVPNLPAVFGPAAGRILAGAEEFKVAGTHPSSSADYDPNGGKIYVVDPAGGNNWFTISGGVPLGSSPCTLDGAGHATPDHCNFQTAAVFHPEDIDLIRRNARFFGVAFNESHVLTTLDSHQFDEFCGQVLVTQELPFAGQSGLSALKWNGSSNFTVTPIVTNRDGTIVQWEHVTFTSGNDCNTQIKIVKTPDGATFNIGDTLSFKMVVTNTGSFDATDVTVNDPLPTTGGLTWAVDAVNTTLSNCSVSGAQVLTCGPQTLGPGASGQVVVKTINPAQLASCTALLNTATATSTSTIPGSVQDTGDYTCTPPGSYTLTKNPKGASYNIGDNISFSMVVTSTGPGTANSVVLNDPLPTLGNLNTWTISVDTTGLCTIVANTLNCPYGNLANGQVRTVTVATNASGGANASACTGAKLNNTATLSATGLGNTTATGDYTCQPGSYTLTKNPKGASYNIGDNINFTMVVTSTGPGRANSVVLNDPLPTLGNLNTWTISVDTTGLCTIVANTLNCPYGNLANGQVRTVTVATNASGGANASACTGAKLNNTATLSATGLSNKTATGDYTCTPPPTTGRMTGGGSIFTVIGRVTTRVTHGFELHCDANDKRQNLEINWPGANGSNNFHLLDITKATCIDDPTINPPPPPATSGGFDTYIGEGTGTCNGQPATIKFTFTDAGEPGTKDTAEYHISGACTLDTVKTLLTNGNHQAHKN